MTTLLHSSPRADGFYMPAEWAPHTQTWMIWPERPDNWRLGGKPAQAAFATVARAIAEFEPVVMLAAKDHHKAIRKLVSGAVELWDIPTDDLWCRDSGPSFVIDGKGGLAVTQFGDFSWMWYADMALAAMAALVNLPIREARVERLALAG